MLENKVEENNRREKTKVDRINNCEVKDDIRLLLVRPRCCRCEGKKTHQVYINFCKLSNWMYSMIQFKLRTKSNYIG